MNPDRRAALLRNILQAVETRSEAILRAERDYSNTLRQLLDQALARDTEAPAPSDPDQ